MINKAILLGRIGKDPELKFTSTGTPVLRLSIATTERFTSKDGTKQETTEWHALTGFGKRFEALSQYLSKGNLIYVEGKIVTRKYEKDGIKKYSTEILISDIQLCGGNRRTPEAESLNIPDIDNTTSHQIDDMEIPF